MVIDLPALALMGLDDAGARQVFADAVLTTGWFDPRVMPLRWPPPRVPRHGLNKAQRVKRKAAIERAANLLHTRDAFLADAARAAEKWCRACAAVLLFGGWRKGRFPIVAVMHRKRRAEEDRRLEEVKARIRERSAA